MRAFCFLLMSQREPSEASVNKKKEADAIVTLITKSKEREVEITTKPLIISDLVLFQNREFEVCQGLK